MENRGNSFLTLSLVVYLGLVGLLAVGLVIITFPDVGDNGLTFTSDWWLIHWLDLSKSPERGLLVLAFFAGIAGSFLHAAQSLVSYIGNVKFKASWATWYLLRPWIGGVLGFAIYFAMRAGFVQSIEALNPYGVVALGMLGGWFSKTTSDKLQEVYESLFHTNEDAKRKDKLDAASKPSIEKIEPNPATASDKRLKIVGEGFTQTSMVHIGQKKVTPIFDTEHQLTLDLTGSEDQTENGTLKVRVLNQNGPDIHYSNWVTVTFQKESE